MNQLNEKGTFPIGIVIDGVRHTAFELRPATVGDNLDAIEEVGSEGSPLRVSIALYARQLVSVGSLPKDSITPQLVKSLAPADFNAIEEANEALKKKLIDCGMPSPGGTQPASSATATASR